MLLLQTRRHILIIVWILTFVFLYIMKRFKTLELCILDLTFRVIPQGIYFLKLPNGILQPIDHTATHTATQTAARDVLCKNLNNHAADSSAQVCCSSLVLARACKCDFDFLACMYFSAVLDFHK